MSKDKIEEPATEEPATEEPATSSNNQQSRQEKFDEYEKDYLKRLEK